MRFTRDPSCAHIYDAFMNAVVACFIGGILGADLVMLVLAENIKHLQDIEPVLGSVAVFLLFLICYLCNNIRKSLDKQ